MSCTCMHGSTGSAFLLSRFKILHYDRQEAYTDDHVHVAPHSFGMGQQHRSVVGSQQHVGQLQRLLRSKYIENQLLSIMKCTKGMQRQWLLTVLCLIPEAVSWEHYYLSCGVSGRAIGLPHKLKQLPPAETHRQRRQVAYSTQQA